MANGGPHWDTDLEGTPLAIVASNAPHLRVQAGPGTGKTFALMRRVMRFLEEGVAPERILVSTFTRTAAHDLANAIAALGAPGVADVKAGTLHSYCFSTLRDGPVLHVTGRVPRPLSAFETRFLLEDLATDFGGVRTCSRRLKAFNAAWARLQSEVPGWPADPVDREFQRALLNWLTFHPGILVGEVIPLTFRYLRDNPLCPQRQEFDRVVVDEYQDLNRAEQELVDMLAGNGTLTIVGDEDQAIYTFKHAHPEGIRTFDATHAGTEDQDLTECRRCPRRVVAIASAVIGNNASFSGRPLVPRAANPEGEVHIVQWPSMDEEAAGIAQFLRGRIDAGLVTAGNVLVLAPRKPFGYAVRDALVAQNIAAHSFFTEQALDGNPKLAADSRAQQAYTLLTLLVNPNDSVALRCWCGFGSSSLARTGWGRLRAHVELHGGPVRVVLEDLDAGRVRIPHTAHVLDRFRALAGELADLAGLRGQALVDRIFPDGQEWAEPLRRIAETEQPEAGDEPYTALTLGDVIRAGVTQPELPVDVDYVRVMSLHKSKGLTADLVVILGCVEGAVPNIADEGLPQAERDSQLEEQRRLFYVALTRAKRVLAISSVTAIPRDEAHLMKIRVTGRDRIVGTTIASRFIQEMGPEAPRTIAGHDFLRA